MQARDQMLRAMVEQNHTFIWRLMRRLGVAPENVDDGVQQVFLITADRVADIKPGFERSWLVGTAIRVASQMRREVRRQAQEDASEWESQADSAPAPDEVLDRKQARALLDRVMDGMPDDLRSVFVLFELEQMTGVEIAEAMELAPGTVASRLRRARESFHAGVKRLGLRTPQRGQER